MKMTNTNLRNQVMYSVYVRNHTEEGTFRSIEPDLERIKALGTDIIWFLPIHPIGKKAKKGSLGCPYAIQNYREVNPCYGTLEDFKHLVNEIHKLGMKCIIDVVYNHTSPDSWLVEHHEEFFYHKPDGSLGNQVGEWTDIVDLDYSNRELWDYQIETLKMWAEIVDGFRCDVASFIPVEFWKVAREAVEEVRPGAIWLAESVELGFISYMRSCGVLAQSDSTLYEVFDICYPYDIQEAFKNYLDGTGTLTSYVESLNRQEGMYPENYVKLRCLENHDQKRIMAQLNDIRELYNFTAFSYFQKGMAFLYAGQEYGNTNVPSLFEYDRIDRNTGVDLSDFLTKLAQIKKLPVFANGHYFSNADEEHQIVTAGYCCGAKGEAEHIKAYGIFALKDSSAFQTEILVKCELPDGDYKNVINGAEVIVKNGRMTMHELPVIIIV